MMAAYALVAGLCAAGQRAVIYVDNDASGANDGSSWTDAFVHLQDALAVAQAGDEIRVAQGVYRPDQSSAHPDGTGDRTASFRLLDGVAVKGGFAGVDEANPNARDIAKYETVLSGDLAGDDVPVVDACDLLTEPTRAENVYHIVTTEPCGRSAVLDGFTIRAGRADGGTGGGAGLYLPEAVKPCRPSIRNCTFFDNSANGGAAVCVYETARPELIDCTFLRNAAYGGGAMVATWARADTMAAGEFVIRGCTFAWNSAVGLPKYAVAGRGGAIEIYRGSPSIIEDCTFVGNTADLGGALYSERKENIVNCRFVQNVAEEAGGAIYFEGTELNLTSCTLFGNRAPTGLGLVCFAPMAAITNTISWNGGDERHAEIFIGAITGMNMTYCNVQGGWPGEGNLDVDPLFADPGYWDASGTPDDPNDDVWVEGDYHLKSQGGRWDPTTEAWVIDDVTSPCIDAGDPYSPIGLEPFPNGGRINMGAYGGTAEASKSYFGEPLCETIIAGDINGDCKVDLTDLAILVDHWQEDVRK